MSTMPHDPVWWHDRVWWGLPKWVGSHLAGWSGIWTWTSSFFWQQRYKSCRSQPMDFFNFLFRDTMWGQIANQTNEYALWRQQLLGSDAVARMEHPDYMRFACQNLWKPVSIEDIRVFAAHLILLGLIKKPELSDYWLCKELTRTPFFGTRMARDRFQAILSNFHVADDQPNPPYPDPQHQPLAKLQSFIDMCNIQFKAAFNPGQNISINEGCCSWRGHLQFKQFNPRKPISTTSKFFRSLTPTLGTWFISKCTQVRVCVSKIESPQMMGKITQQQKQSSHFVKRLVFSTRDIVFTWIPTLHLCHWHTNSSVGTHCAVVQHDTTLVSHWCYLENMIRSSWNRVWAVPSDLFLCCASSGYKTKTNQGSRVQNRCTCWPPNMWLRSITVARFCIGQVNQFYKPCAVVDYCHEMGGVDLTDQLLEYYHFLRRSCKWWRKLWVHLSNMVILNAFLLNKNFGLQKNLTQPELR